MIYIDQPSTTGFSYSIPVPGYYSGIKQQYAASVQLPNNSSCPDYAEDTCGTYSQYLISSLTNSTDSSANNFWLVLQGFMGAFPQYSRGSFHFTTESYGGHYAPVYNESVYATCVC